MRDLLESKAWMNEKGFNARMIVHPELRLVEKELWRNYSNMAGRCLLNSCPWYGAAFTVRVPMVVVLFRCVQSGEFVANMGGCG